MSIVNVINDTVSYILSIPQPETYNIIANKDSSTSTSNPISIIIDSVPTLGSNNAVSSNGVAISLNGKANISDIQYLNSNITNLGEIINDKVPKSTTITINGETHDLTQNASFVVATDVGSVQWGSIGGTIAGQTDLNSILQSKQPINVHLTEIASINPVESNILQYKSGSIVSRSITQLKTDLAITKTDIGLPNVDNTSDINKPISTAVQNALNTKQATLVSGTTLKTINNVSLLGSGNITITTSGAIDSAPTSGSGNAVSSGGVFTALASKANSTHTHAATDIVLDSTHRFTTDAEKTTWNAKQTALVSGTSIKTINGNSLLGSGDIVITSSGGGSVTIDSIPTDGSANAVSSNGVFDALTLKSNLVSGKVPLSELQDFYFAGFTGDGLTSSTPYVLDKDTLPTANSVKPITSGAIYDKSTSISLAWFGIPTDGTDQSVSIQAAINFASANNKILWIPEGVYYTGRLYLPSNTVIDGVGTLKAHSTQTIGGHILQIGDNPTSGGKNNVIVKNITLDGNRDNTPGDAASGIICIKVWNSSNININNVTIQENNYLGVVFTDSKQFSITNCNIINTDVSIITFGGCRSGLIANNIITSGTSEGISLYGNSAGSTDLYKFDESIVVTGNVIRGKVYSTGINLRFQRNNTIVGNSIEYCHKGICTESLAGSGNRSIIISGNTIRYVCNDGIAGTFLYSTIIGNTVEYAGTNGIWIGSYSDYSNYNNVNGNTIINASEIESSTGNIVHTATGLSSVNLPIRAYTFASGGNRISDYALTGATNNSTNGTSPQLIISSKLTYFYQNFGTPSIVQNYTVSGTGYTSNLVITPPANMEIANSASGTWGSSLAITPSSGTIPTTNVYLRLNKTTSFTGAQDGIRLTNAVGNKVHNNNVFDDRSTKLMRFGFHLTNNSSTPTTGNVVMNNFCSSFRDNAFLEETGVTSTYYAGNVGGEIGGTLGTGSYVEYGDKQFSGTNYTRTLASSTLTLPNRGNYYVLNAASALTLSTISTYTKIGRELTFKFSDGNITLDQTGNIRLSTTTLVSTSKTILILVWDGTSWLEKSKTLLT